MGEADIAVLHVDDDEAFASLTAEFLQRRLPHLSVSTETNPNAVLDRLESEDFDCIVSDYNMPEMTGLDLLRAVRDEEQDLPFILFTGRGSEEIASDAISAGVTDYIQKELGKDQDAVLANRIQNAVEQYRTKQEIEETRNWYRMLLRYSSDYVLLVGPSGDVSYASPSIERVAGYTPEEVEGKSAFEFVHPDDLEQAAETLAAVIGKPDEERTVEFRSQHRDGRWNWLEVRGRSLLHDPLIEGIMVNVRDITERKKREVALAEKTERLQDLTSFMSHDMRNQLTIARGRLDLIESPDDEVHVRSAIRAVDRVEEMIEKLRQLAEDDTVELHLTEVSVATLLQDCWAGIVHENAELVLEGDVHIDADQERLRSLIENLLVNALDHVGDGVLIRFGPLEHASGFFLEDDGPGIPEEDRENVFESGYSGAPGGSGLGLSIVKRVVEAHGWEISISSGSMGGACFEIYTE